VITGPWNVNRRRLNVIMLLRNVIMGLWNVKMGLWNVNTGPVM